MRERIDGGRGQYHPLCFMSTPLHSVCQDVQYGECSRFGTNTVHLATEIQYHTFTNSKNERTNERTNENMHVISCNSRSDTWACK